MSILIKGMKMPEYRDVFGDKRGCVYLLMLTVNKDGTASMQFNDVDGGFYRVKEIPTPHGDLIDRDDVIDEINRITFSNPYDYNTAYDIVKEADTIIEAEVRE